MQISLLTSEDEYEEAFYLLKSLRSDLILEDFLSNRVKLIESGYRLFGLREGLKLVTVAGVTLSPHISRIQDFWIHDFVTLEDFRSSGYGLKMFRYLEQLAMEEGFDRVCLYTLNDNDMAQNFYETKAELSKYGIMYIKKFG